jgi:hypothetical protein
MSMTRTKRDATRIDTTHHGRRRGRKEMMGQVIMLHAIVPEDLWLLWYSNVPDGWGYILPVASAIGSPITDDVHWWELINKT